MRHLHLVKVRYDRRRPDITDDWLRNRFAFFLSNTCRSLAAQDDRRFVLWLQFQDGLQGIASDLLQPLARGYEPNCEVRLSFGDGALPLSPEERTEYQYVYVTRIDSDDLFAPDAVRCVNGFEPERVGDVSALMFRKGFIHDTVADRTGIYTSRSGPFHTLLIPTGTFCDPAAYASLWERVGDHSKVVGSLKTRDLPDHKFCVLVHGNNFLSTFDYGRERGAHVQRGWSIERFLNPPVVFDVDDFSDRYGGGDTLDDLLVLKERYPDFKCTLFTIPARTHHTLLQRAARYDWVELCPHGWTHEPNDELRTLAPHSLVRYLEVLPHDDIAKWVKLFRPPSWHVTAAHISAIWKLGYAVALNKRDRDLALTCPNGYYENDEWWESWHGHTHDVCGNYLRHHLPDLLGKWSPTQRFAFASEAVTVKSPP